MSKIGSVSQTNNAIDMNQTLDMSGWVNVEMPEEEINRVGSRGAERLDKLASLPPAGNAVGSVADCASLVERLYATALRKADGGCIWWLEDARGERSGNGWTSLVDLLVGFSDGLSDRPETRIYG